MMFRARLGRSLPGEARRRGARRLVFVQPRLQYLEDRCLPSTVNWTGPNGGDWDTGANWSTGTKPGAGDDAVINRTGVTLVTHQTGAVDPVNSVSSVGATIDLSAGTLNVATTLSVSGAAAVQLRGSATLANANVQAGTRVIGGGGTLDTVTLGGTLDLSGSGASANVVNGLTLAGGANINVTGIAAMLQFTGTQTLGGRGTVNVGPYNTLQVSGTGASLTIDTNVTVSGGGTLAGPGLVLNGTIAANNARIYITAANWTNSGTIETINGGALVLGGATSVWSNTMTGVINAGSLTIAGTWSSPGAISINAGGSVTLGGSFHTADLDNFTTSASTVVTFNGTITNTSRTLTLNGN